MEKKCYFCGDDFERYLPFKCKYCHHDFCHKHRIPETHECTGLKRGQWSDEVISDKKSEPKEKGISGGIRVRPPRLKIPIKFIVIVAILIAIGFYIYNNPQTISNVYNSLESSSKQISSDIETPTIPINVPLQPKLEDIVKNPESYYQKPVSSQGIFTQAFGGAQFLQDEQGYNLLIEGCSESQRTLMLGSTYKAKGTIKRYEYGDCEYRYSDIDDDCVWAIIGCRWFDSINCEQSISSMSKSIRVFTTTEGKNITLKNFLTNHSTYFSELDKINNNWTKTESYTFQKKLTSECPTDKKEYYKCSYDVYEYDTREKIITEILDSVNGTFFKEYRINPESIKRDYYLECTEPMVKIS